MTNNGLTPDDLTVLKRAFPRADHEFIRGFVYLTEDAITDRIEEVDPAWSFEIVNIEHTSDNAIAYGRMTVKGVMRDGIGMQKVNEKAGEAAKGAATDALKRCARLFGVGRYLLDAPNEDKGFDTWLAARQKDAKVSAPPPSAKNAPAPTSAPKSGTPEAAPVLYADAYGLSWHDKRDGKGSYYRLHANDGNGELLIVAFDTTALTELGFDLKALTEKGKTDTGYDIRVPYMVDEKDGKTFYGLDVEAVMLSQQYTGEPT